MAGQPPAKEDAYRLMWSFLRTRGFASDQIASFDKFVDKNVPEVIMADPQVSVRSETTKLMHSVCIHSVRFEPPSVRESSGTRRYVTPSECVLRGKLTYALRIKVDATYTVTNDKGDVTFVKELQDHDFDYIPCAKFSKYCNARRLDPELVHEDTVDPGGYFIIEGMEKCVTMQEQALHNAPMVTVNEKTGSARLEVRSEHNRHRSTSTLYMHFTPAYPTATDDERRCVAGSIEVQVPFVPQRLRAAELFRVLGVLTLDEMMQYVVNDNDPSWFVRRVRDVLAHDAWEVFSRSPQVIVAQLAKERMQRSRERMQRNGHSDGDIGINDPVKQRQVVNSLLSSELFPQQGYGDSTLATKTVLYGEMIRTLLLTVYGLREVDDRDNYANRRAVLSASLLTLLFRSHYSDWRAKVSGVFRRARRSVVPISEILTGQIGSRLAKACSSGNFSVQQGAHQQVYGFESAGQQLTRIEPACVISAVNRLNNPVSGKAIAPRLQDTSCIGCVDPNETPDSKECGLVRNKAALAGVRHGYTTDMIRAAVELAAGELLDRTPVPFGKRDPAPAACVYITGALIGTVQDGPALYTLLRELRSCRDLPWDLSIYIDEEGSVRVEGDAGSIWWPLLRCDRLDRLEQVLKACPGITGLWDRAVNAGCIECVNKSEEAHMVRVALDHREWRSNPSVYTHVVIHPSQILSEFSARVPIQECNQNPRNVYATGMIKQGLGRKLRSTRMRFDTTMHTLRTVEQPLVTTHMDKVLGGSSTQMAMVAIMCHGGYTIEDSITFNKASLERGLGIGDVEHSFKTTVGMGDAECEKMQRPPEGCTGHLDANYDTVDPVLGVALPGTQVNKGSVLLSKVAVVSSRGAARAPGSDMEVVQSKITVRDRSVQYKHHEPARVSEVVRCKTLNGEATYRVKTTAERRIQVGVKCACLTEDHSVLCKGGVWVPIASVTTDHEVACMDGESLVYYHPTHTHVYQNPNTRLIRFNRDIVVTEDHRMCIRIGESGPVELVCAKSAVHELPDASGVIYMCSAAAKGYAAVNLPDVLKVYAKHCDDNMWSFTSALRVLGALCREYSFHRHVTSTTLMLSVHAFQALGGYAACAGCTCGQRSNSGGARSIILTPELFTLFQQLPMNGTPYPFVYELSKDLVRAFIKGYCGMSDNSIYTSTIDSVELMDCVSALAVHAGYTVRTCGPKFLMLTNVLSASVNVADCNSLTLPHGARVYCLTVPTGVFCVRRESVRGGAVLWTGNSRHGQKGTCGQIVPQEDMPFSSAGPIDVMFNPHGIPSRMTWGQLIEMIGGTHAAVTGEEFDGTPFTACDEWGGDDPSSGAVFKALSAKLTALGLEPLGVQMYSGITGRKLDCQVFVGPLSMLKLKHDVMDKLHARTYGPKVTGTNQAVEGRAADGGGRFGEMERDCLINHGASWMLWDRHHHSSDKRMVPICTKCGFHGVGPKINAIGAAGAAAHSAYASKTFCHHCMEYDTVQMTAIPGGWHLCSHEFSALHIKVRYKFSTEQDGTPKTTIFPY